MNNKIQNAFSEIYANESLKQQIFKQVTTKKKKITSVFYRLSSIMVIIITMFFLGNAYFTPISYISIDINPSIELRINKFDRVIAVIARNEEAKNIVNSINLKNLNYIDAMESLESSDSFAKFSDNYIEVTVLSNTTTNSDNIIEDISSCSFGKSNNVICFSSNNKLKKEAQEFDISFGKYRAYLELLEVDQSVTIDDIKELSMKSIREMIEINEEIDKIKCNGKGN